MGNLGKRDSPNNTCLAFLTKKAQKTMKKTMKSCMFKQ